MGRSQYMYNYPEVHPPHPQAHYTTEAQPQSQPVTTTTATTAQAHDSRYSWMDASREVLNAQPAYNRKRQSSVPPLPNVPEHLHHDFQQQQYIATEQPQVQQSHPRQQYQPNYQQQDGLRQQEATMYQVSDQSVQQNVYPPRHPNMQPDERHDETKELPDPVKEAPDHPNYRSSLVPDENPLTPTTPTIRQTNHTSQTTNMPVMPPTPSNYTFNAYAPVPHSVTGGSWTHSLCSCSEPTICMTGLFCPCILYGRTQHRLALKAQKKDPTNMLGHDTVNGSCMAWAFLCGVNGIFSGIQKTRVRRTYEMDAGSGNVFNDCLLGCCCCCCVLAQNEKEIKHREEDGRKQVGGPEGYVPPSAMTFSPPPR